MTRQLACVAEMTADGSVEASVMLKFFDAVFCG